MGKVNETYARVMGDHRPARAVIPVKDLHFDTKIEIAAIAAVKTESGTTLVGDKGSVPGSD